MTQLRPVREERATMLDLWRQMLRIRRFDEAATKLLRAGQMPGVLHLTTGQEAVVAGASAGMGDDDLLVGTHRNHGYPIARGGSLGPLMAEVLGKATGVCKGRGGEMHLVDPAVGALFSSAILGSGLPVAVGTALASQIQRLDRVTLATFGDGASNEGAIHESMNLAAIWKLPVIFLCENNGYAVTVPASYAVSVRDIAVRAAGYGMPGHIVDGSDPLAVRDVVREARERAASGDGPSLVEAKTYRTVDHAENLPSQPYRSEEEVEGWRQRDPIGAFRERLLAEQVAAGDELNELSRLVQEDVDAAVAFALESPHPDPGTLFDDMYVDIALNRPPAF